MDSGRKHSFYRAHEIYHLFCSELIKVWNIPKIVILKLDVYIRWVRKVKCWLSEIRIKKNLFGWLQWIVIFYLFFRITIYYYYIKIYYMTMIYNYIHWIISYLCWFIVHRMQSLECYYIIPHCRFLHIKKNIKGIPELLTFFWEKGFLCLCGSFHFRGSSVTLRHLSFRPGIWVVTKKRLEELKNYVHSEEGMNEV